MMQMDVAALGYFDPAEFGTEGVVFADTPDGDENTLEIQRGTDEPDEQDVERGQDTYCLVVNAGATVYGGVRAWTLGANDLRLELEPWAAAELGVDDELVFDLTRVDASGLRDTLERVLR
jgi:hypothetical protein